ncbi:MAG TPA: NAD(P)H-binding protein [Kofleriaceae bacterium]|nr:NAD(P)H-binding protein [Kofleriaceae bacterium]
MSSFVVGATGFTGREVVRVLAGRGEPVVAHVRSDSSRADEWRQRFTSMSAEVDDTAWEVEAMTATLRRLAPSLVFALLGTTRKRARGEGMSRVEAYQRVDVGLTLLLLDAVRAAGLHPRFVYLSSVGTSERSGSAYLKTRAQVEAALRASGVPFTIARPSFISGSLRDDGRPFERAGAVVADGIMAAIGVLGARRLRAKYRPTTASALAQALVRAAFDPTAEGQVLEGEALFPPPPR